MSDSCNDPTHNHGHKLTPVPLPVGKKDVNLTPEQEENLVNKIANKVHDLVHEHDHDHGHGAPKVELPENAFNLEGVKGRWQASTAGGKTMMVLGGTVGVGAVMHGILNMKRGLFGYDDTQTGEHRKGSVENLLVGAGETYVGAALFRRMMSGKSWALWK